MIFWGRKQAISDSKHSITAKHITYDSYRSIQRKPTITIIAECSRYIL